MNRIKRWGPHPSISISTCNKLGRVTNSKCSEKKTKTSTIAAMDDDLREAAAVGDVKKVTEILSADSELVNSQNSVNGWTALHWACKRNYMNVVEVLVSHGGSDEVLSQSQQKPHELTTNATIYKKLTGTEPPSELVPDTTSDKNSNGFKPSYMTYPSPPTYINKTSYKTDTLPLSPQPNEQPTSNYHRTPIAEPYCSTVDTVLKVRLIGAYDFIEVEIENSNKTLARLVEILCSELNITQSNIVKLRKLPNTLIRKDKDVARLVDFQEIEVVIDILLEPSKSNGDNLTMSPEEKKLSWIRESSSEQILDNRVLY